MEHKSMSEMSQSDKLTNSMTQIQKTSNWTNAKEWNERWGEMTKQEEEEENEKEMKELFWIEWKFRFGDEKGSRVKKTVNNLFILEGVAPNTQTKRTAMASVSTSIKQKKTESKLK